MNRIHRVVWNEITATWVAVAEIAKGHGKGSATVGHVACPAVAPASLCLPPLKELVASLALIGVVMGTVLPAQAWAQVAANQLPTGGNVVAGTASITQNASVLNINQTTVRAAIDWSTFNVGSAAEVNFNQPSSSSVTLNRVIDSNPSQIFGKISAPGQVLLTNPNGVYFAPGASVDVGGLVATTHSISNADFMAGKTTFERNGSTGSVINAGELKAALGGYIALLAPEVRNEGVITAQAGTVALASGEAITLKFADNNTLAGITATKSQIDALVENKNAVLAPGGLIILSAMAMNSLQGGVINNSGSLQASSLTEKGGRIILEGDTISLTGSSQITATGATGGGEVLVGGDWQGSNDVYQATTVTMESGARIDASATKNGDGGKVVLWSDVKSSNSVTTVNGTIYAKAGAGGGHGGRIETSGKFVDLTDANVNASSSRGLNGFWLIDPDMTLGSGQLTSINSALNTNTNVEYFADNANLVITNGIAIRKTTSGTSTLTLKADGNVIVGSGVTIASTGGLLNVDIWSDFDNDNKGAVHLKDNTSIVTKGGSIRIGGGSDITSDYAYKSDTISQGVLLDVNSTLNAGGGGYLYPRRNQQQYLWLRYLPEGADYNQWKRHDQYDG